MKKIISLLLFFCMMCPLLASCNWKDFFRISDGSGLQWKLPDGIIETTLTKDGISLTIAHSENFTQDDIEFVAMWHNKTMGANFGVNDTASFSLGQMIRNTQDGFPLYLMNIENPYIIVAYLKSNFSEYELDERNNYQFDIEKYLWYKFSIADNIPDTIEDNKITVFSYVLYDCTITKEIGENLEYNYRCKYYLNYNEKSNNIENSGKFLAYYSGDNVCSNGNKFLSTPLNDPREYKIYTDENGIEYLEIQGDTRAYDTEGNLYVVEDYVRMQLWPYEHEYYDILSQYFIYFSHSEFEDKNDGTIFRYAYIKIDDFINAFFSNK